MESNKAVIEAEQGKWRYCEVWRIFRW